jgi:hypothetical protein
MTYPSESVSVIWAAKNAAICASEMIKFHAFEALKARSGLTCVDRLHAFSS